MEEASSEYDAYVQREAENKAAQEKADEEMAAALEKRKAGLLAQSPEPAVLMVDGAWYFQVEGAGYWDAVDEDIAEEGAEDLARLLLYAETIGHDFDTMDAFLAANPDVVVSGLEPAA
jgi:hypothetical protein